MNLIVHEGRVGRADYRYPYLVMDRFTDPKLWNKYLQVCLSHDTWFEEGIQNQMALEIIINVTPSSQMKVTGLPNGPYSVENFPEVEEVFQTQNGTGWTDFGPIELSTTDTRTVLRFKQEPKPRTLELLDQLDSVVDRMEIFVGIKQEPNKAEVVADFGKECYLRGLKDGVESVKHEPKEEPNPSTSFFKFVQNQHPDPDHLMSKSVESAWPEICKLADKYREEPKTGESQAEVRDTLIDFVNWFSKLKPSDKCTVHPPAGSGGSTGLYNLTNAAIVDKFLTRKQTEQ